LAGALAHPPQRGHRAVADDLQRAEHLELLDVLGEVELLDARLDVVARDPLPRGDGGEIDLLAACFVGVDRLGRDGQAEVALGLHHGDPEFAFQHDAAFGGPEPAHGRRGVSFGEDVRHVGHAGSEHRNAERGKHGARENPEGI